jgi:Domain of unknown function (DUF4136)
VSLLQGVVESKYNASALEAPLKTALFLLTLLLSSATYVADDHNVDYNKGTDFSKLKTFFIRPGTIISARPELNNTLVAKQIMQAIRAALVSKGLREVTTQTDVIVEFKAIGVDYNIGPGGVPNPISASLGADNGRRRGGPGDPGRGSTNAERGPVDFSEGTLVIDVSIAEPVKLIWRGVYHDNEKNSGKLAKKLPDDAKKLLSKYPAPKK